MTAQEIFAALSAEHEPDEVFPYDRYEWIGDHGTVDVRVATNRLNVVGDAADTTFDYVHVGELGLPEIIELVKGLIREAKK